MQNGEDDSRSSQEKKSLERISSFIITGRDAPEIFQATKTTLYYIPAFVSLPVVFPRMKQVFSRRMKQVFSRRDRVSGAPFSKVKSNLLCPIRPITQNIAAVDFSKLLQKRDGFIAIGAVAGRQRQANRYPLPIYQGMNLCVLSSAGPPNTGVPLHRFLGPRLACSDTLLVVESIFSSSSSAFAPSL